MSITWVQPPNPVSVDIYNLYIHYEGANTNLHELHCSRVGVGFTQSITIHWIDMKNFWPSSTSRGPPVGWWLRDIRISCWKSWSKVKISEMFLSPHVTLGGFTSGSQNIYISPLKPRMASQWKNHRKFLGDTSTLYSWLGIFQPDMSVDTVDTWGVTLRLLYPNYTDVEKDLGLLDWKNTEIQLSRGG